MKPASRLCRSVLVALAALSLAPASLHAQPGPPTAPLRVIAGTNGATANGQLKGPADVARDYVVSADAGSTMTVSLRTSSAGTYFSVIDRYGSTIYTNQGDQRTSWSGQLIDAADYRIRVFLDDESARQARGASYTLNVSLQAQR